MEVACRLAGIGVTNTPVSREDFTTFPPVIQRIIIAARAAIAGDVLPRTTYRSEGTITRFLDDLAFITSPDPEGDNYVRGVCFYIQNTSLTEEVIVDSYTCDDCNSTVEKVMLAAQITFPIAIYARKKFFTSLEGWHVGGINLKMFPHFSRDKVYMADKIAQMLEGTDPHYEISSSLAFRKTEFTLANLDKQEPISRVERVLVSLMELPEEG